MLHDRILVLVNYIKAVLSGMVHRASHSVCVAYRIPITGSAQKDHATIRSLAALVASLPASDSQGFREEFETVCAFVLPLLSQLTSRDRNTWTFSSQRIYPL